MIQKWTETRLKHANIFFHNSHPSNNSKRLKVCFHWTQKRLRIDSKESRRTKCCESGSFWATRLCWVLDFVRRDAQPTLGGCSQSMLSCSRLWAVKVGGDALLHASMAHFHRVDTLQPNLGTKYFSSMYLNTCDKCIQILSTNVFKY